MAMAATTPPAPLQSTIALGDPRLRTGSMASTLQNWQSAASAQPSLLLRCNSAPRARTVQLYAGSADFADMRPDGTLGPVKSHRQLQKEQLASYHQRNYGHFRKEPMTTASRDAFLDFNSFAKVLKKTPTMRDREMARDRQYAAGESPVQLTWPGEVPKSDARESFRSWTSERDKAIIKHKPVYHPWGTHVDCKI
eukprot:TRINITY_DN17632_c0_g1_i1.p1 TRINITY_DN17632_c0_g1~~TRINITY_DN17632_c0_g1_i1.p1  ORF type:complete len:195 (+),score=39.98 TRINITY_DN17632_c0_g1_i1:60-644(+)